MSVKNDSLKSKCVRTGDGYYLLTEGVDVPIRLFMTPELFDDLDDGVF